MNLFNYSKPGKGVDKDVAEPPLKIYFDVLYRKFWDLIKLNLLYVAFSLPLLFAFFVFILNFLNLFLSSVTSSIFSNRFASFFGIPSSDKVLII